MIKNRENFLFVPFVVFEAKIIFDKQKTKEKTIFFVIISLNPKR